MDIIQFANIYFRGLTLQSLLVDDDEFKFIITANAEIIVRANEKPELLTLLNTHITTFDGQVPFLLAKMLNRKLKFQKLSGSDIIYDFADMAKTHGKKMFLLGGNLSSNERSVAILRDEFGVDVKGYSPPYRSYPFDLPHNSKILQEITAFSPDILFVGLGAVKQEFWIRDNLPFLRSIGVRWVVGSGGTFEFVSSEIQRAPKYIQIFCLEGVFRFFQEPKWFRFKRILVSLKIFQYLFWTTFFKKNSS